MKLFHMNLLNYNANTQFPAGGQATQKQVSLRTEMGLYQNPNQNPVPPACTIAGFTEVIVADTATQANVENALNDLGTALRIPQNPNGQRHIAVIRCGRSALTNSNEVVALVIDPAVTINTYGILYFDRVRPLSWLDQPIPVSPPNAAGGSYTAFLQRVSDLRDYRFIVYVDVTLAGGNNYRVGFIHNRAPKQLEAAAVMRGIRRLLRTGVGPLDLTLCGGDFNVNSLGIGANGVGVLAPQNGVNALWYYSPGNTTNAQPLDYWISETQLLSSNNPPVTANATATPTAPSSAATGSDHRGVGIEIL